MKKTCQTKWIACALITGLVLGGSVPSDAAVSLKQKKISLTVGQKKQVRVKGAPKSAKITYKSDKPSVASVSKKGMVRARSAGKAKITVRIRNKKKKKTIKKLVLRVSVAEKNPVSTPEATPEATPQATQGPDVSKLFTGDKNAPVGDGFISQTVDFSVNLFKNSVESDVKDKKNTLVSPLSVLTDMMMATDGAASTTKAELSDVMCGGVGFEAFRKALSDYNARLIFSEDVRFHIANSVWIREDPERLTVKPSFIEACEKWYNAYSEALPFDSTMVKKVNEWVNKNTFGMIPVLLEKVPPEGDVIHLINALAFDGAWAVPYDDFQVLKDRTFTNAEGTGEKTTMLADTTNSYKYDEDAVGFVRPYKGFDYSFLAILPNQDVGVEGYLNKLTGRKYSSFWKSGQTGYEVHTMIPEFSYDYSATLNDALKKTGIREAFQENADFSEMAETRSGALYINTVTHKTHIELDRYGTKAAAVTDIGMNDTTSIDPAKKKQINIFLDRPFIYAIVHSDTGIPVFMGVVNRMS